ncbi:putative mFS type sugar transporter [Rickettsia hoogstraalii str. RCCE3]|nr:putative mFS type sugar transporter [Rickettsia hoogstraalii str. RCCE3]
MLGYEKEQRSLNLEQKKAIGILSTGTFLEYFDLMLYVHMTVLLNKLFFPQTDVFTSSLFTALAFCSTYILRPLGALIFWLDWRHYRTKNYSYNNYFLNVYMLYNYGKSSDL